MTVENSYLNIQNPEVKEIVRNLTDLGAPGLILFVAIETYGVKTAVALSQALYRLRENKQFENPVSGNPLIKLGKRVIPILAQAAIGLFRFGSAKIIKELFESFGKDQKQSTLSLQIQVAKYPISDELKTKINYYLDQYPVEGKADKFQPPAM